MTADQAIDELVRLRSMDCDPEIYRQALIGLQGLVIAETCGEIALDMMRVERVLSDQ